MRLPLSSSGLLIFDPGHRQAHAQGLVGDHRDGLGRNALGEEAHRRARSQSEIDRLGDEGLLHLRVAGENQHLDGEAVLGPDFLLDADVDRREGERLADRLRDTDLVLRLGGPRPDAGGRQYQTERRQSPDVAHASPLESVFRCALLVALRRTVSSVVVVAAPGHAAQRAEEIDDVGIRHVFAHVITVVVNDVLERPPVSRPSFHAG